MARQTTPRVFFLHYLAVLLFALLWVHFPHVRDRVGENMRLFYLLCGLAVCYLGLRAYLVLRLGVSGGWEYLWLAVDLAIISVAVSLSGGLNSEAALVYFIAIVTSAIQRRPRWTLSVGLISGALYVAAVILAHGLTPYDAGKLGTRIFLLLIVTSLAACYASYEARRVEEIARLREKVALADYRTRLSQEMHDGIQHYLVNMATRLELARKVMDSDPARAAGMAVDQRFTVRQAADELRYLVRRLRSPVIEQKGFLDALEGHLSMFAERSSISAPIEIEGGAASLPPDVEQAAFRIVQEALTNAEKHAQASEVKVRLAFVPDGFRCVIADDGVGFDPADAPEEVELEAGMGLPSMRHRAESVGGQLQVTSVPGEGTEITLTVPLPEGQAAHPEE